MKKIGAISLAAFYLLLTTGMYVCILHCTADYFLNTHEKEHHAQAEESDNHEKEPCGKDENCTCCNTHGQYAIKENIPTGAGLHFVAVALLVNVSESNDLLISQKDITPVTWPKGNAPPAIKEPLYISHRSLLI